MIIIFALTLNAIQGYWLENIKPKDGHSRLDVIADGGRHGGQWKIKVGEIELTSGSMSAAVNTDAPFSPEGDMVDINCYQNCVEQNSFCNENWLIRYDEIEYRPPGEMTKNLWEDMRIDSLSLHGGSLSLNDICQNELTSEEKGMFEFKEHSWLFFHQSVEMYIREFENLGAYIFGIRIVQMANVNLGQDSNHTESNIKDRLDKLLFGFPSIRIPATSESFFWWLKGNNFGFDNLVNGQFTSQVLSTVDKQGQGIDSGPFMLFNKNQKDALIISPFASKETVSIYITP